MALPLAGIAANLLLGAAIAGVGLFMGGGSKKPSSPTPKSTSRSSPVRGPAPFLKTAVRRVANAHSGHPMGQRAV